MCDAIWVTSYSGGEQTSKIHVIIDGWHIAIVYWSTLSFFFGHIECHQDEVGKAVTDLETDINAQIEGMDYFCDLPEHGWDKDKVLQEIDSYMSLGMNNLFSESGSNLIIVYFI